MKPRKTGTHGPIEADAVAKMKAIGYMLDEVFNPGLKHPDKTWGFVLLSFRFGEMDAGRINYLSNGEREDVVTALKELLARFEGRHPEETQSGAPEAKQ